MKNFTHVNKAVFPVAGLGTRFLPATKAQPKEMLPVVDKPLIQYAVEEAYEAGIRHMIFVTGRNKRAIEDHFDTAYELESELEATGKKELLALVRSLAPADMDCSYVRQPRSLGLGHAVLCARHIVRNDPFAVLLADDLMVGRDGGPGVLKQMVEVFLRVQTSVLAVQEVPVEHVKRYGIVAGESAGERLVKVRQMVEKALARQGAFPPGRGRPLRADACGVRLHRQPAARQRRRDPAHRWHRAVDRDRRRACLPVRGQALRLRQQGRLPGGVGGVRVEAPGNRARLPRLT
jgi:dTDP-glucose pyrophosphorylase